MTKAGSVEQVKALYSAWPYPSRVAGDALIYDLANLFHVLLPKEMLRGIKVLDAGCGSGHRLVGLAKRFPNAEFWGVDMTEESLEVARDLAVRHGVTNVRFVCQSLPHLDLAETFDIVTATGVIHHLEDPAAGLANLCRLLAPDGIISLWLYHAVGEFNRLTQRELLRTLWTSDMDPAIGFTLMRELGFSLDKHQYSSSSSATQGGADDIEAIDVDAYMHPIVHAYRFCEAIELFADCNVDWVAVNGVNLPGESKLVDLAEQAGNLRPLCLPIPTLLNKESLLRYRNLDKAGKLRVIELLARPTGFTLLAGKGNALSKLGPRVQGNHVPMRGAIT